MFMLDDYDDFNRCYWKTTWIEQSIS